MGTMTDKTDCCPHVFVRYVLTWAREGQADGTTEDGHPYRDIPMVPSDVAHYAATIGSDFMTRVIRASCASCGHAFEVPR